MNISVIIPVYHESEIINSAIENIQKIGKCEIIVSDCIGDTSDSIIYNDVTSVISSKGRGIQMNTGAKHAKGDVFVFLHADTKLPDSAFDDIINVLNRCEIGAFDIKIDSPGLVYRIVERTANLRSRLTGHPYGDQAVFCTRKAFEKIGGFCDIPIMEDVRFMQDAKRHGMKTGFIKNKVLTSARRWKTERFLYTIFRNWTIITLYYLGISPLKLKKFYKDN